jgi:hypothetical protein
VPVFQPPVPLDEPVPVVAPVPLAPPLPPTDDGKSGCGLNPHALATMTSASQSSRREEDRSMTSAT